ncbi:MAG TPA: nucleotidyltransferase family protein [Kiritimatiellia bacterium]|nr:nucleotidyltransferase family protein [Kiritimatiellia bacterium]
MTVGHPLHRWLTRLAEPGCDPVTGGEAGFISRHRLEPLAFALGGNVPEWEMAYAHTLAMGASHLREAGRLAGMLESAGVDAVWTRGVFHGVRWYGDFARRPFTDLDVVFAPDQSGKAFEVLREAGYGLRGKGFPAWYFRRYHLHWPMRQEGSGMLLDAHWAVDHAGSKLRAKMDEVMAEAEWQDAEGIRWREPSVRHQMVLACLHLAKECDGYWGRENVDPVLQGDAPGRFLSWLDAGLMMGAIDGEAGWEEVWEVADAWRCREVVETVIAKLRGVAAGGGAVEDREERGDMDQGFLGWLGQAAGFRPRRLAGIEWGPRSVWFAVEAGCATGLVMMMNWIRGARV